MPWLLWRVCLHIHDPPHCLMWVSIGTSLLTSLHIKSPVSNTLLFLLHRPDALEDFSSESPSLHEQIRRCSEYTPPPALPSSPPSSPPAAPTYWLADTTLSNAFPPPPRQYSLPCDYNVSFTTTSSSCTLPHPSSHDTDVCMCIRLQMRERVCLCASSLSLCVRECVFACVHVCVCV
jgi:hypothetical protein